LRIALLGGVLTAAALLYFAALWAAGIRASQFARVA
jgi:hypothetical protein